MMDLAIASVLAALTVSYWALCRFRSVGLRAGAADVVAQYIESEETTEADAKSAYATYLLSTKWWFLPLGTLMAIPIIPYIALFDKKEEGEVAKIRRRKVISSCMLFHIVRNPLISVTCLSLIFVWTAVFFAIALLTRRMTAIPTFDHVLDVVGMLKSTFNKHAH